MITKNRALLIIGIFLIVFIFWMLQTDCGKKEEKVVKIGVVTALTGPVAPYGDNVRDGCLLATDEINLKGGIGGHKIELFIEDEEASPQKAVSAVQKLITTDKVQVIIGPVISSGFLAAAPVAEKRKVVLFSPSGMADNIRDAGDFIFRNRASASQEAGGLAKYIVAKTELSKMVILRSNSDYAISFANVCRKVFEQGERAVLVEESFEQGATDFRTQLAKIKVTKPDAILIIGIPVELGNMLKQIKELGFKVPIFSNSIDSPQIFQISHGTEEGLVFSTTFYEPEMDNSSLKEFDRKFRERFGRESHFFAANAYDAIYILKNVLEKKGYTGEKIRDGLYSLKGFKGVTGNIEFDKKGDLKNPTIVIKQISHGKFNIVEQIK